MFADSKSAPPRVSTPGKLGIGRPRAREQRIITITGAKGGVGKTVFATNLAIYLATIGRKVVLVDADASGANAHTLLGVDSPESSPLLRIATRSASRELTHGMVETSVPGLRLLRTGLDAPATGTTQRTRRARLIDRLRRVDAEYLVVDLGNGTSSTMLDSVLAADFAIFVATPEPTSIENTHRFIRGLYARRLLSLPREKKVRYRLAEVLKQLGGAPAPRDCVDLLVAKKDPSAAMARTAMDELRPLVVLNQVRVRGDLELGDALRTAMLRRFGIGIEVLGFIDYDDSVWSSGRARKPLLVDSPGSKASRSLEKVARKLVGLDLGKTRIPPLRSVPEDSYHDILDLERGANDDQIRRAYKRAKEIYSRDSLACYGLFTTAELQAVRARVDEAFEVMLDPVRRRPYELSVFPSSAVEPAPVDAWEDAMPAPPPPDINPTTEFTGALLRDLRESRGVDIQDVCKRTKITVLYLTAIEEEDFGMLPAAVYVRGFVAEIAKVLGVDPAHASRTYVKRYSQFLADLHA